MAYDIFRRRQVPGDEAVVLALIADVTVNHNPRVALAALGRAVEELQTVLARRVALLEILNVAAARVPGGLHPHNPGSPARCN